VTIYIQPPSALVIGPPGSGKTFSIATQLLAGLNVAVIMTEPDGVASLLDACERLKAPIDKLHWITALPTSAGWAGIEDMLTKVNTMDQKGLADTRDMGKAHFKDAALRFLNCFRSFVCERTGQILGDFTCWDDTWALNVDSLSGWNEIAWGVTCGHKPTANPGEWGIAQKVISGMLLKINNDRRCYFNLFAHTEKEMDEMSGVKRVMVSTIGAKLAPQVPKFFSEVIKAQRLVDPKSAGGVKFIWATLSSDMDLKNRALPVGIELAPDFRAIVNVHEARKKLAAGPVAASTSVTQPSATAQGT
jgi:hypothetical protein